MPYFVVVTVPLVIRQYIENYCLRHGIAANDRIFPITERAIQKQLAIVCDYLGYEGIGTHSFRKWYATAGSFLTTVCPDYPRKAMIRTHFYY